MHLSNLAIDGKSSTLADTNHNIRPGSPDINITYADIVKLMHFKNTHQGKQQHPDKQHTQFNTKQTQNNCLQPQHQHTYAYHQNPNNHTFSNFVRQTDPQYNNYITDKQQQHTHQPASDETVDPFEAFFNAGLEPNKKALEITDLLREKFICHKNGNS